MSTEIPRRSSSGGRRDRHAWTDPYRLFAVTIMLVLGLWQVLAGLSAVLRDGLAAGPADDISSFGVAGWGGVVLGLGVLTAVAGVAVLQGRPRADTAAVVLAVVGMVVNFLLVPVHPVWSVVIIALDATLIWTLTTRVRRPW